ncbi:cyanate transport [Serratia marcescens]|jgi:Predicted membrane protein|nr:cyanate transport [Serratia marcescens]BEN72871.1 cyanate transport [Serratia marcescens]
MHFLYGYKPVASILAQVHTTRPLSNEKPVAMKLNVICYALLGLALVASLFSLHPVWMWLLLANLLTFLIYGGDKLAARKGWRRVPEATLLLFGALGGWLGALAAQQLFRHKTQKQPFKTWFILSVALNLAVVLGLWYWVYGRWIF